MEKYQWRKEEKEVYLPKAKPCTIEVPPMQYLLIEGKGHPESEDFKCCVEVLYGLSYAIRMMPKKGYRPVGYYEYTVFPLEGIWGLDEEGVELEELDKNHFVYTLMIRQPTFVTGEVVEKAMEQLKKSKPHLPVRQARLEVVEEGLCVQMMHIGSYDEEGASFAEMERYCQDVGLRRIEYTHKEIYISDPRKTTAEKRKTVLRFRAKKVVGV